MRARPSVIATCVLALAAALVPFPVANLTPTASASTAGAWVTPTRPENCSTQQALSGDVRGCVVSAQGNPERRGWGHAPDPSMTDGFTFDGWSYSGPSERRFADEFVVTNSRTVAGRSPGSLRTHVAASALFEGFLDEIHQGGYAVDSAHGYVYRCTSGSGGNCAGGSMSNHAWGLAVDVNPGANPERTYTSVGEVSACAVPQQTDVPRWVVEVAESWGLFWGGYGFRSGGCNSPEDWSTSVRRDPHHFEFRGTVEMALAIAEHRKAPVPPMSCFDTVGRHQATVLTCNTTGVPSARTRTRIPVDAPAGTTAVVVTATASGSTAAGYLTVEPCSVDPDGARATSNTNFAAGEDSANTAIVAIGRNDDLCIWRSAPTHAIVDVVGYVARFDRSPDAMRFSPITPARAADTRTTGHCAPGAACRPGPAPAGSVHEFRVDRSGDAVVNVAAVDATSAGFVSADRCGRLGSGQPATSTVNHLAATPRANMTFVTTDDTAACLFASATADLIVDVAGVLGPSGLAVTPVPAKRVLDTRACSGSCEPVAAGSVTKVTGAVPADGAIVNLTVTAPTAVGYASIQSCASLAKGSAPNTSTVNFAAGSTVANLAFVASGESDLCIYASAPTHLVVDVQAALSDSGTTGLVLAAPVRAVDTRT